VVTEIMENIELVSVAVALLGVVENSRELVVDDTFHPESELIVTETSLGPVDEDSG